MILAAEKQCSGCGEIRAASNFYCDPRSGKPRPRCKSCFQADKFGRRRRNGVLPRSEAASLRMASLHAETRKRNAEAKAKARAKAEARRKAAERPWNRPGLTSAEQFAIRYRLDPEFNLKQRLRAAFKRKRQGIRLGDLLRSAVVRNGKSPKAEAFVGYTARELRAHLERQFTKDMDWQRFCAGEIHIDHIRPLTSFDLSDPNELRAAWALTNLRPLWAEDNIAKSAKLLTLL